MSSLPNPDRYLSNFLIFVLIAVTLVYFAYLWL